MNVLINHLEPSITTTVTENVYTSQDLMNITIGLNITDYEFPFGFAFTIIDTDFTFPKTFTELAPQDYQILVTFLIQLHTSI